MLLRCTTRLRELLGEPMIEERPGSLEDWYANVLWVQRRKCLLLTHAGTLFSVFAPNVRAADLRPPGAFVVPLVAAQLAAEGFPPATFQSLDPDRVTIAETVDRQVLGCMNELALICQSTSADPGGLARLDLPAVSSSAQSRAKECGRRGACAEVKARLSDGRSS